MYSLLLALIYIAFISLGLPDSLLGSGWPVIHNDLNVPISFMGVVSMVISGGTIVSSLFSDKLTRKLGARIVTVASAISYGGRVVWIFLFRPILDADRFCRSLRSGRGSDRRRAQQLRRPSLCVETHELAALFLGRGNNRQSLRHELRFDKLDMESRLSNRRLYTAGHRPASSRHAARLESPSKHERASGNKKPRVDRRAENQGSPLPVNRLFRVLRRGSHRDVLGEHLFCRGERDKHGTRGGIRFAVLYRNHRRKVYNADSSRTSSATEK